MWVLKYIFDVRVIVLIYKWKEKIIFFYVVYYLLGFLMVFRICNILIYFDFFWRLSYMLEIIYCCR